MATENLHFWMVFYSDNLMAFKLQHQWKIQRKLFVSPVTRLRHLLLVGVVKDFHSKFYKGCAGKKFTYNECCLEIWVNDTIPTTQNDLRLLILQVFLRTYIGGLGSTSSQGHIIVHFLVQYATVGVHDLMMTGWCRPCWKDCYDN